MNTLLKFLSSVAVALLVAASCLIEGHAENTVLVFNNTPQYPEPSKGVILRETLNEDGVKVIEILISSYPTYDHNWEMYNDFIAPMITLSLGEIMNLKIKTTVFDSKVFTFDKNKNDLSTLKTKLSSNYDAWEYEPEDDSKFYFSEEDRPYYRYWIADVPGEVVLTFHGMIMSKSESGYWGVDLKVPVKVLK